MSLPGETQTAGDNVRHDWFQKTVRECQVYIGRALLMDDYRELHDAALELAAALPDPRSREEDLVLRGVLIGVAAKWGQLMHGAAHAGRDDRCRFEYSASLGCFWRDAHQPAKRLFRLWADDLSEALAAAHPVSCSQQAAVAIRADYAKAWSVTELAALVGVTPSRLSRAFVREHGFAVPEFQRRVRLLNALERIDQNRVKIETVALQVGYRSKKNFYRAFVRLTGLTPTRFRQLTRGGRNEVIDSVRLSLVALDTRSRRPADRRRAPARHGRGAHHHA
mgnify:CR=1 FL=1